MLQIAGTGLNYDLISETMGLTQFNDPKTKPEDGPKEFDEFYSNPAWIYRPSIADEEPIQNHIDALSAALTGKRKQLDTIREMPNVTVVDIVVLFKPELFFSLLTLPPASLEIFKELDIPLQIGVCAKARPEENASRFAWFKKLLS